MPFEVKDKDLFKKYVEKASECVVYKDQREGVAKVKARIKSKRRSRLITIKIPLNELDDFIKELNCPSIREIS